MKSDNSSSEDCDEDLLVDWQDDYQRSAMKIVLADWQAKQY
jgi:hypothetical protein